MSGEMEENKEPLLQPEDDAPSPAPIPVKKPALPPVVIIPIWISLSAGVILYNKYIFAHLHFRFPIFLTAYHMLVACIKFAKKDTINVSWTVYTRRIIPLAGLFAMSLMLSNIAYLHLSVSFAQMLKAFIPILTLIIRLFAGLEQYSRFLLVLISVTSVGCAIAASGEIDVSLFGLICQIAAIIMESCRLVTVELVLKDVKPLQSVTLYAPLCFAMISLCIPLMEGQAPFRELFKVGFFHLLLNGAVAFGLNIAGVFLIESAGSVVLTLSGVVKDVLLLCAATILFGSLISGTQAFGYTLALGAIVTYKLTGGQYSKLDQLIQGVDVRSRRSYITFGTAAALLIMGVAAFMHGSPPHDDMSVSQLVTYPINTVATVNGKDKFGRWTQHGPGLKVIPPFDDTIDVSGLVRLAWVVVATPDAIAKYGDLLNTMACYSVQWGIPFYLEHQVYVDDRHFFTARYRSIAKYLRYHQWILATDADTLIAQSKVDVHQWLDDTVDVIYNDRINGEICACAGFIRNSPGGWAFLRRWFAWSDTRSNVNYDNGDLVEMIGAGLAPGAPNNADNSGRITREQEAEAIADPTTTNCVLRDGSSWWDYSQFTSCFNEQLHSLRHGDDSVPYWQATLWNWTTNPDVPPSVIRSYKSLSGFSRITETDGNVLKYGHVCLPGDFLLGGKNLEVLVPMHAGLCTGEKWILDQVWTEEQARKELTEMGFTWYPGCWVDGQYIC